MRLLTFRIRSYWSLVGRQLELCASVQKSIPGTGGPEPNRDIVCYAAWSAIDPCLQLAVDAESARLVARTAVFRSHCGAWHQIDSRINDGRSPSKTSTVRRVIMRFSNIVSNKTGP